MKYLLYAYSAISLLLGSCGPKKADQAKIDWTGRTDTLTQELIHPEKTDSTLINVSQIIVDDNMVFIGQERVPDMLWSVFQFRQDSIIRRGTLVQQGKGPYEVLGRALITIRDDGSILIAADGYNDSFFIADGQDIDSLLLKSKWKIYTYPATNDYIGQIRPIGTNGFLMTRSGEKRKNMYDRFSIGDTIYKTVNSPFPKSDIEAPDIVKSTVYDSRLLRKPQTDRYISVSMLGQIVCIFDLTNDSVANRKYLYNDPPVFKMAADELNYIPDPDTQLGFRITVTPRYIYLMESLNRMKDFGVVPDYKGYPIYFSDVIYVYDWEGNPIRRYILEKPGSAFGVDPHDKFLYLGSIDLETQTQEILRFALPKMPR